MNTIVKTFRNPKISSPFIAGMLSVFDLTQAGSVAELKKGLPPFNESYKEISRKVFWGQICSFIIAISVLTFVFIFSLYSTPK
jgi:hypothetical protein